MSIDNLTSSGDLHRSDRFYFALILVRHPCLTARKNTLFYSSGKKSV